MNNTPPKVGLRSKFDNPSTHHDEANNGGIVAFRGGMGRGGEEESQR